MTRSNFIVWLVVGLGMGVGLLLLWWVSRGVWASEVGESTNHLLPTPILSQIPLSPKPRFVAVNTEHPAVQPSPTQTLILPSPTNSPSPQPTSFFSPTPLVTITPTISPSPTHAPIFTPTPTLMAQAPIQLTDLEAMGQTEISIDQNIPTIRFGRENVASYLFANQLKLSLPTTPPNWLNFQFQLTTTETLSGFDDPALVILMGNKPLFAISTANWNTLSPDNNWLSFSIHLPETWLSNQLTFLGGDNGDLSFPTTIDLRLVSFTAQPLFPLPALPVEITVKATNHQESSILQLASATSIWPFFAALDTSDSEFFQTDQLLWLTTNLLSQGEALIHHSVEKPPTQFPLTIWPFNLTTQIRLLPSE